MEFFESLDQPWIWFGAGLALAALELVVPGVYLIWLAVAAIATGILSFLLGIGIWPQVLIFATLSLITVYSAKRFLRDSPISSPDPEMNDRGARMVGQRAMVTEPITAGEGRVKLGDSEWIARGEDAPKGAHVVVTKTEGAILFVGGA